MKALRVFWVLFGIYILIGNVTVSYIMEQPEIMARQAAIVKSYDNSPGIKKYIIQGEIYAYMMAISPPIFLWVAYKVTFNNLAHGRL